MKRAALFTALTLAAAPVFASGTAFGVVPQQDMKGQIELPMVRSATSGVVSIYNFHGGERGALLGQTAVNAGANVDVTVDLAVSQNLTKIAVLTDASGQVIDTHVLKAD